MSASVFASARPVFIVGSPRSGTSILTWCLGQHSNILAQEESSWIGPLTFQIENAYRLGTARGERSQLSALGVGRPEFFAEFGEAMNRLILRHREKLEERGRACSEEMVTESRVQPVKAPAASTAFKIARKASDPKMRWVDGTPEYSFHIHALRKLFPQARFIHLVRDVSNVVRSMLTFERTGGPPLVQSEQEAYDYWLRTVRACLAAERAYGSAVIYRLRHSDLTEHSEGSIREVLNFLGEPFETACLEPLGERINSSKVPGDYDPSDPKTDPALVETAWQLSLEMMEAAVRFERDEQAISQLENAFRERADELARRLAPPAR